MNSNSNNNNMVLPLTDSSDESSIDQTPTTTTTKVVRSTSSNTPRSASNANTSASMINTAMSFEEDGSVVVDLMEDDNVHHSQGVQNIPTSRAIFNENDMLPQKTATTTNRSSSYPPKRTRNQRWLTVVLGMALLLCFVCGIYFFLRSKRNKSSASSKSGNGENLASITLEELSLHDDTINDCWILIDDIVYDVTQYAPTHPGGAEYVTDFCGANATKDYYINHPVEYLNIYLTSDARKGVISTDSTDATTTNDNSSANKKNNTTTTEGDDKKDDDKKDDSEEKEDTEEEEDDDVDDDSTSTPTMEPDTGTTDGATAAPTSASVPSCISIDEVMLHSTDTDCYYILYDYVYDFTNYIDLHPGGARKVFQECGTDATAVYITEKFHDEDLLLEVNAFELYGLGYAC